MTVTIERPTSAPATRTFDEIVALPADAVMSRAEHRVWYWAHLDQLCELLSRKTDAELEAFDRSVAELAAA